MTRLGKIVYKVFEKNLWEINHDDLEAVFERSRKNNRNRLFDQVAETGTHVSV